jgi:hypothetical protein
VNQTETISSIKEQEVFVAALCVDIVWRGDSNELNVHKNRLIIDGWPRAMSILLLANKQLLSFLERSGNVNQTPRSLIDLANQINSWLPPVFQMPGDVVIDAIQMVANPFSSLAQKNIGEHTEEIFMDWLFLFSGLVGHCAEMMNHDPYTVLLKTLSSLENLPQR